MTERQMMAKSAPACPARGLLCLLHPTRVVRINAGVGRRVQPMSTQTMICFALRASWRRAPLCLVNLRVARCAGFWSSEASPCRRTRKRNCSPFRRQRTPNLVAVPCRQRPKRAPERERERERDRSSCSNGSSWAARAVLMRLTRAPATFVEAPGARVSDL